MDRFKSDVERVKGNGRYSTLTPAMLTIYVGFE